MLLLTALLVFFMPWMEYFLHFDMFLRGGQDFELGLLTLATSLCLALVLLQQRKRGIAVILAVRQWLSCLYQHGDQARHRTSATAAPRLLIPLLCPSALSLYNLPLQI